VRAGEAKLCGCESGCGDSRGKVRQFVAGGFRGAAVAGGCPAVVALNQ
jgi:hypothetical protein